MTGGARRTVALLAALAALICVAAPAAAAPPAISGRAAIVVEASSGEVVLARRADERRAIASTTKLMTALVALEQIALDDVLTAPRYHASPLETRINLRAGERMRVADLIRALLLPSANDAAATLARGIAGSPEAFVALMNERARTLGLRNTHFANPIGLDGPANYSSARDLARLTLHLRREHPFFARTTDQQRAVLRSGAHRRVVVNRNPLVRQVPWIDGVKTGHTLRAGYVLVGSGTRRGITVVSVVLGTPSELARARDTLALLRYGIARFRRVRTIRAGAVLARADLEYRDDQVELVAARSHTLTVRRGRRPSLRIDAPEEVEGPLPKGARVGTVAVRYRGRTVARVPLVTARAVPEAGLTQRIRHQAGRPWTVLVAGAVVAGAVALALLRRRAMRRRRRARRGVGTEAA